MITDEMRAIVGIAGDREISYPIDAAEIRRCAMAIWYPELPPPDYWDEEDPVTVANGGIVAPDDFDPVAWIARRPRPEPVPEGGHPPKISAFEQSIGLVPLPVRATLQVEIRARYSGIRMRPGDVIEVATSITGYSEREGRMGLQLYTTLTEEFTNQLGEWIKSIDTVYVRY